MSDTIEGQLAPIPDRLGPLRIGRLLGRGAGGCVYEAVVEAPTAHLALGAAVAVKVLHSELALDAAALARFRREGLLGARVVHESVVRTHDVLTVEDDGRTFHVLVQERVDGRSLAALLAEMAPFPEPLVRSLGAGIARGLVAIHAAGAVHRDIKPSNVIVTADHQVKIADLGVAALDDGAALTTRGSFVGTPLHSAPEQFHGQRVGASADLYALGVLLYEAATGTNPFAAASSAEVMQRHLEHVPRPVSDIEPRLTPFLDEVIATLLQKRPERRLQDAAEVARVLGAGEVSGWWTPDRRAAAGARKRLALVSRPPSSDAPVGREVELAQLRAHVVGATTSDVGSVALLRGPAGIGRTCVMDAVISWFAATSSRTFVARASLEAGGTAATLALLADDLSLQCADPADPGPRSLPSLLLACARLGPTLVLVEDVHLARAGEASDWRRLATAATAAGAAIVFSTRPEIDAELESVLLASGALVIDLPPLSAQEASELVARVVGSVELASLVAPILVPRAAGHPAHLVAACRDLAARGVLDELRRRPESAPRLLARLEVPTAVRSLIASRLRTIDDGERELLDVAAVLGSPFDANVVADVLARAPLDVLQGLVRLQRRTGLVIASGATFRFESGHVEETVLAELPEPLRVEFHVRVARLLRARGAPGADVAEHALRGGLEQLAMDATAEAIPELALRAQHRRIEALLGRALVLFARERPGDVARLLLRRVDALHALGDRDAERTVLEQARAGATGSPTDEVRLRLARLELAVAAPLAAREWLAAIDIEGTDRRIVARRLELLAACERAEGRPHGAVEMLRAARREADAAGDAAAVAGCEAELARVLVDLGELDVAEETLRGLVPRAQALGDDALLAKTRMNLATCLVNHGWSTEAEDLLEQALATFVRARDAWNEATALSNLARALHVRGERVRSREIAGRALGLKRAVQDRRGEGAVLTLLFVGALEDGDLARARELLARRIASSEAAGLPIGRAFTEQLRGQLAQGEGRLDAATAHYRRALELHRATGSKHQVEMQQRRVADCLVEAGDEEAAIAALREAESAARDDGREPMLLVRCLLAELELLEPDSVAIDPGLSAIERLEAHVRLHRAGGDARHQEGATALLALLSRHLDDEGLDQFWRNNPVARLWRRPLRTRRISAPAAARASAGSS